MERKKSYNFPIQLAFQDKIYSIKGYIADDTQYINGKGYIDEDDGQIYICSTKKDSVRPIIPTVYIIDGHMTKVLTPNEKTNELFSVGHTFEITLPKIEATTAKNEVLYSEEALMDMNAATSVFRPIINDTDDGWKKCIKKSILAKGRDINSLKYMTGDKYTLTNMKTALNNGTRMSVTNFSKWCELLGLDFEIRVMDNGSDPDFPLVNDIVFSSVTGKVYLEGTAEDPNKK